MDIKVLYVCGGKTGFVNRDYLYLRNKFSKVYLVELKNNKQFLSDIIKIFFKVNVVFIWFAGRHAILPVILCNIFSKTCIIVAGGYDVASVKEINYGSMLNPFKKIVTKVLLKLSDHIISISESNRKEAIENANISPNKIYLVNHGFKDTIQLPKSKPLGFDDHSDKPIILSIGEIRKENYLRKGLRVFAECAKMTDKYYFVLAGRIIGEDDKFLREISKNKLIIYDFPSDNELLYLMKASKYYVQPSLHEGFGCSLAESMVEKCVPIVSRAYSIPYVVGDCGLYINSIDPVEIIESINKLENNYDLYEELSECSRNRILNLYSYEKWKSSFDNFWIKRKIW